MTPSEHIVADATAESVVTDSIGRKLTLRKLTVLDKLRLFKAAGPILAQNQAWLGVAVMACSVTAIDGVPVPTPVTEQQIEGVVERLGDAGIAVIAGRFRDEPAGASGKEDIAAGN